MDEPGVIGGSVLGDLDPLNRARLLAGARTWFARSGETIFPASAAWTRAGMILDGIARSYLASSDGRQLTIRYVRPGGMIGSAFPIAGDRAPLAIAAITDCRVLEFDTGELLRMVRSDVAAATLFLRVLDRRLEDLYAVLAASAFGSMREQIAGHLLDLAHPEAASGRLVVTVTQQQLADSCGTVREVVARTLREFREEGLVATSRGTIEILDATRLAAHVGRWRTDRTR
jgi:CRP/FNR family transcriptional regulator, cyclic AMP receptor protein